MIPITRKAAAGFLLLGILVFLTAQFTFDQAVKFENPRPVSSISDGIKPSYDMGDTKPMVYSYRQPLVNLGENAPLIITGIIEGFTLICYLILKKLEPSINKAAEDLIINRRRSDDQNNS